MPEIVVRGRGDFRSLQRDLARAGGLIATGLGAAALGVAKASIDVEKEFSQNMNLVAAATDAPARKLEALSDLAVDLGAKTAFSANDAAEAMLELAKAGLSPATIQAGALEGTLTLAAAGGTDLATAATVASNALNTFSLEGKDMASVAAAMAGGANASSASVESLALGLAQVGSGAVNAGLSLQETVGVLSAFDAAGVKGSDAGTSLKTMLARLVPSTEKQSSAMGELGLKFTKANGEFLSITQIAQQLQDKLGGLSAEQRTAALATIFGSDATRAATILMRQGESGIRKYIKATQDQGAAEDMAAARMKGTAGALERLSGAAETAELRIGQALAPAVVKGADAIADRLVPATDAGIEAVENLIGAAQEGGFDGLVREVDDMIGANGDLVPILDEARDAFDGLWRIVEELAPAFLDASSELTPLLSPLHLVAEASNAVADVLGLIPDDMLSLALQAGAVALILPRLTATVTAAGGAMVVATTRTIGFAQALRSTGTAAQTQALGRFAGAARTAAGIGGLLALTNAMQDTTTETESFGDTVKSTFSYGAAGALVGFSVGGPVGAAVGAVGGLAYGLYDLSTAAGDNAQSLEEAAPYVANYADTFDDLTGAITRATRAEALKELKDSDMITSATQLGISTHQLINAMLGQGDAFQRVRGKIEGYTDVTQRLTGNRLLDWLTDSNASFRLQRAELEKDAAALSTYRERLEGVPRNVRVALRQAGFPKGKAEVDALLSVLKVTPEQKRIVYKALGISGVKKDAKDLSKTLDDVDVSPTMEQFLAGLVGGVDEGKKKTKRGMRELADDLETGTKDSKADLKAFARSINEGIATNKITAKQGALAIGSAIKYGLPPGFSGAGVLWSTEVAAAVRAAIQAGRNAAGVKSPSRETAYIGDMMVKGLADALTKGKGKSRQGGRNLIEAALAGVGDGSAAVDNAIDRLTSLIEKRVDLKDAKAERAREKKILAGLHDEFEQLRKIGKEHDANARKLERWNGILEQRQQQFDDYVSTVRSSFQAYGNIVGLGAGDDGSVSVTNLIDQLRNRVANAQRFADLIRDLRDEDGPKLTQAALQQLIDAGPEAALATAEALAAGGDAAVTEINRLSNEIAAAGGGLGEALATQFYQGGIDAAEAMVAGLEKRQRRLDRMADRFADRIAEALEKALGGKRDVKDGSGRVVARSTLEVADTYARTTRQQVEVRLTAQQASRLKQGEEIVLLLDYAIEQGVRSTAIGS